MDGDWKTRMWSIQEMVVMEVQLVNNLASGFWSARVRLGFCQPVRLAHLCKARCVPSLSVSSQLEFKSPSRMVCLADVGVCAFYA
jgi:hypothetical protein